jgi:ABC-type sugar transport system substrate-binding protein
MTVWLRNFLVALAVASVPTTTLGGDIRVAFIDATVPREYWKPLTTIMQVAAAQLGIDVEIRETGKSRDKALAIARDFLAQNPPPDYLIASNDVDAGGEIIKLADAAHVKLILINNDLDPKDWAAYGAPRAKYPSWLGSIVPDHEGAGYGVAVAILGEAATVKRKRPLKLLGLTGDTTTPGSTLDRVRGMKHGVDVMQKLLGPNSIDLLDVLYLDWTAKTAERAVREFTTGDRRVDVVWAANDPMALGAMAALVERGYRPGTDVLFGGINWNQAAVDKILSGEMVLTYGGNLLQGAWAMVLVRDFTDGRDFAEEDVRQQIPMTAIDRQLARRFPKVDEIDWRKVDFTRFCKSRNPTLDAYKFTLDSVLSQLQPAPASPQ